MAIIARMPIGTVTLALLLHVRALTGSFAAAGAAVGIYLGASAATAPFVGRWIDRRGPRWPLRLTGFTCPAVLLVILLGEPLELSASALWLLAGLAGAFFPPIAVLTRTMWRYRFDDAAARKTAFALDAVLVELTFTVGPALIALLLAIGSPAIALAAACVVMVRAVPTFVASPALR
jgi:MFS family permease